MRKSLTLKIFIIIFIAVFLTSMVGFLTVSYFTENYYLIFRVNDIKDIVTEVMESDSSTAEKIQLLNSIAFQQNAFVEVYDNDDVIFYESTMPIPNSKYMMGRMKLGMMRDHRKPPNREDYMKELKKIRNIEGLYTWYGQINSGYNARILLPEKDITKILDAIKRLLLLLIPSGFLFALISAVIMSYVVSRPIVKLNKAARQLGNMQFDTTIEDKRKDEIGELASTLNWLSIQLGNTFSRLKGELEKEKKLDGLRKLFIAQVSHEIKTPISVISSYTEALTDNLAENQEDREKYLDTINGECIKLNKMVENLLDLSQIEAGTFKIKKEDVGLHNLASSIFTKYKNIIKDANIEFNTTEKQSKNQEDRFIEGDMIRLTQVLDNFIQNAIKHTPREGTIKLSIEEHGNKNEVVVENTGSHIEEEHLPHIWDYFYKATDKKGRGLGLSIAKSILDMHGFSYTVKNTESGVRFSFIC